MRLNFRFGSSVIDYDIEPVPSLHFITPLLTCLVVALTWKYIGYFLTYISKGIKTAVHHFPKLSRRLRVSLLCTLSDIPNSIVSLPSPSPTTRSPDVAVARRVSNETSNRSVNSMRRVGQTSIGPPGLGNWGNSCYQNSVIQGLSALTCLRKFLANQLSHLEGLDNDATIVRLTQTLTALSDISNDGKQLWLPTALTSMNIWQQQDAQEYYSKVFEQIDRELKSVRQTSFQRSLSIESIDEFAYDQAKKSELVPQKKLQNSLSRLSEFDLFTKNPLNGMLAQRVGCTECGYSEGLCLIPFSCLTVPLGNNYEYDIRKCLDEYTKLEFIEGVICVKCTMENRIKMLEAVNLRRLGQNDAPEAAVKAFERRLNDLKEALEDRQFSDEVLIDKLKIPRNQWTSTTKSRQAIIARAPEALVFHINRSIYDERTGMLRKNFADVKFPLILDLDRWCLGESLSQSDGAEHSGTEYVSEHMERWEMNPEISMLPSIDELNDNSTARYRYQLRALVTHYGRHENGHYVCFKKQTWSTCKFDADVGNAVEQETNWWRLSDDDVDRVSEEFCLEQGNVFMLFYERMEIDDPDSSEAISALSEGDLDLSTAHTSSDSNEADVDSSETSDSVHQGEVIRNNGGQKDGENLSGRNATKKITESGKTNEFIANCAPTPNVSLPNKSFEGSMPTKAVRRQKKKGKQSSGRRSKKG